MRYVFKLSFHHISRLGRGRYFPSLSFCFHQLVRSVIARAMCALLNVTVAATCISSVQGSDQARAEM